MNVIDDCLRDSSSLASPVPSYVDRRKEAQDGYKDTRILSKETRLKILHNPSESLTSPYRLPALPPNLGVPFGYNCFLEN
ncbi:hypothetical protein L484_015470 [Morus notabilis]|uniref:Uncharacterized protein n=1 Tax=Morus notabilis TaxID=981085 RepID=W9RPQ9_9ROSA|nr:hypothetical protein L484_015470 [Morus notabilis]